MIIYLGIGTNLGQREQNLNKALSLLDERVGGRLACSSIYRSAPQGFESKNEFANIVVVYQTDYLPEDVLLITQKIEREMGRNHKTVNGIYQDRVIDVDLLKAYKEMGREKWQEIKHTSDILLLPHPRMEERDFVCVPMHEVEQEILTIKC